MYLRRTSQRWRWLPVPKKISHADIFRNCSLKIFEISISSNKVPGSALRQFEVFNLQQYQVHWETTYIPFRSLRTQDRHFQRRTTNNNSLKFSDLHYHGLSTVVANHIPLAANASWAARQHSHATIDERTDARLYASDRFEPVPPRSVKNLPKWDVARKGYPAQRWWLTTVGVTALIYLINGI